MERPDTDADALARKRFMVINLVRVGGIVLVLGGILAVNDALPFAVPAPVAYFAVAFGMFEAFFIPTLLSRKWSTRSRK